MAEIAKETKFLLVTAVPKRGFRRCGFEFSRDKATLVDVAQLDEKDKANKIKPGTSAKRLVSEGKMLVVKQLSEKPQDEHADKIAAAQKKKASDAVRAKAVEQKVKAQEEVKKQVEAREEGTKPRRWGRKKESTDSGDTAEKASKAE